MRLIITEADIVCAITILGYMLYEAYTQKNIANTKLLYFKSSKNGKIIVRPSYFIVFFGFLILLFGIPFYPSFDIVSFKYWLFFLTLVIFEIKKTRSDQLLADFYPLKHLFKGKVTQKIFAWITLGCIITFIVLFLGLK